MSRLESFAIGDAANFVGSSENRDLAAELRHLASPIERGEKVPVAIDRARKAASLPYWRCWNIWYGKARHIAPEEYAAVAAALEKKRRDDNRAELQQLWTRLVRLESALAQTDPDFHRPSIDALRNARRQ
jgi:hypothetical protein